MAQSSRLFIGLFLAACSLPQQDVPAELFDRSIVDLTHPFNQQTVYWPTSERFQLRVDSKGMNPAGYYYEANSFATSEHGGTHLDAPVHFAEGKWTTDRIPLENLIGEAAVVNVEAQASADPDYLASVSDLRAWEAENGPLAGEKILLIRTGYSRFWPDAARYLGTAERGEDAVAELHFPGLSPEAARWIVSKGTIGAVGIDTASIDYGQSRLYESHRILFQANIPVFENLTGLEQLPSRGAIVVALPMKIEGGSGGPLRVVAFLED